MLKKSTLVAFIILSGLFVANAALVSRQTAQNIALNFYKVTVAGAGRTDLTATLVYTSAENDGSVDFYVFNISPGKGFVIVAATDNVMPVLAYSSESNFSPDFTRMGVNDWVKHVSGNIHNAVANQMPQSAHVQGLWQAYLNGQNPNNTKALSVVGPLLKTTWNQEPYYNILCPYDTATAARAVTGCVATAMAQIMKYWAFPAQGTGSYSYDDVTPAFSNNYGEQSANFGATTYNWAAMANNVTSNTSPADTLSYQCGVAVAMDYGTDAQDGSGAFVTQAEAGPGNPCAQMAYATYFSYNPNTMQGVKQASYNANDWLNLMRNELNSGRVIQYEGDDPTAGGHTWVCDGYDNTDLLHMNWGWGGSYDGYYAPSNLNAGGYDFSEDDGALIGIEPLFPIAVSAAAGSAALCPGGSTTLTAQGPADASYTWTPTTGLTCPTCYLTTAAPTSTTLYTVTVDSNGVTSKAFATIVVAQAVAANFSLSSAVSCTLPQAVTFSNATTNATSYVWSFGDGLTDTSAAPVHAYNSYGNFNVTLVASNACYSDSITQTQAVQIVDKAPISADQNICSGQTVTLTATDTFGTMAWYNLATGGTSFNTGNTYTTAPLNTNTVYYVQATIPSNPTQVGPVDSTIGSGNYYTHTTTHGLMFNSLEVQQLDSVTVYSSTAGNRTINLLNSAGATLNTATINIGTGEQRIALNFPLPVADSLELVVGGTVDLHRNLTGASFPYTSTDGNLVITGIAGGGNFGTGGVTAYYYFYNWQLQPAPALRPVPPYRCLC